MYNVCSIWFLQNEQEEVFRSQLLLQIVSFNTLFSARRYVNAEYAMALCPTVCLPVRPSVYRKSEFY